ncbi:MAG: hypothetical protein LDL25_05560 [Hyphomicrobiales bacterium]|nr:hypothetical protein [Hyphomicrobiales bacterium]
MSGTESRTPYVAMSLVGITGLVSGLIVALGALALLIANSPRSFWEPLIWGTFLFEVTLAVVPLFLFRTGRVRLFARAFAIGAAPGLLIALTLVVAAYT